MCSTDIKFLRSKLLQSYSNFTLKPKLEPTAVACLAGRDAYEVFILDFSKHRAAIQGDCGSCQTSGKLIFRRPPFLQKHNYTILNELINGL